MIIATDMRKESALLAYISRTKAERSFTKSAPTELLQITEKVRRCKEMRYSYYREQIENTSNHRKLEKLLHQIEEDFEGISGGQYEKLRLLIISKMYA